MKDTVKFALEILKQVPEEHRAEAAARVAKVLAMQEVHRSVGDCELCGTHSELRPYGQNGEKICFPCGMKDEQATGKRMRQMVFGEGFDA